MKKILQLLLLIVFTVSSLTAQNIERIEPPNWWTGMKNQKLQLIIYGKKISKADVVIKSDKAKLLVTHRVPNDNYLFLDLEITKEAKAGKFMIQFLENGEIIGEYDYVLKEKTKRKRGFSSKDLIYLAMPDRFANGDYSNDNPKNIKEAKDRKNPNGRHGGDIQGVINNLDYIQNLGVTALWLNPTLLNDRKEYSYHGYGITDFYKTDPRSGSNDTYMHLAQRLHSRNMKIIMDMIFNHCGANHWWIDDLPTDDWLNKDKNYRTNYRGSTVIDPHVAKSDLSLMTEGWFVESMPDLNQNNPFLATYLIQNTIWWIEFAELDGIRVDTQPYPFKKFMADWANKIHAEYPDITLLGETWLHFPAFTAYFQGNSPVAGDYNSGLNSVTDFPLYYSVIEAFNENEGWKQGMARLYLHLAQDFLYNDANNTVIFLDNHDLDRFYTSVGEDINKLKMGLGFLLTTRGIPMIYYGTEIGMTGSEHKGHGDIRKDFPGGWTEDSRTAFTKEGRTDTENEIYNFVKTIALWRKDNKAVTEGKLTHFVPQDGVYVYFKHTEDEAVMVILNNNDNKNKVVDTERFSEILDSYNKGIEIISKKKIMMSDKIEISSKSVMIIELYK